MVNVHREMHNVAEAANKVVALPLVPSLEYSTFTLWLFVPSIIVGRKLRLRHLMKLVTTPTSEFERSKFFGRSNKTILNTIPNGN